MERLRTTGFLFTRTDVAPAVLTGDYGDGYHPPGAVIGAPSGVRGWTARIDVLPDDERYLVEGQTRANYLWAFFVARKMADDEAFWLYDHKDDLFYPASFVDDALSYSLLCAKLYATGLQFQQRRVPGEKTSLAGVPLLDHNNVEILDEDGKLLLDEGVY